MLNRRDWLQWTGLSLAACTIGSLGDKSALAVEPPVRPPGSHLKLSLAAYSFHKFFKPAAGPPKLTLPEFIDYCAKLDLDGTELTGYYFPTEITPDYLRRIKAQTFRLGLDISGTAIGNDFCVADGPAREKQLNSARQWIDHAAEMGAPVIRIFAGNVPKGDTEEAARDRAVAGINEILEHAAQRGVFLALENHGGITSTSDQLLAIVKAVRPSDWFGVNFDSGNFRTAAPYADLARIAPYAFNVQIKVSLFPGGKQEPADWTRIVRMLREAHYRGYIVLEYEEPEDPFETIPPLIKRLREIVSATERG